MRVSRADGPRRTKHLVEDHTLHQVGEGDSGFVHLREPFEVWASPETVEASGLMLQHDIARTPGPFDSFESRSGDRGGRFQAASAVAEASGSPRSASYATGGSI